MENGISISYSGEKMTWPCPSYTRISSPFGWRIHPTLGVNKFHNGVDMAAPKGTNILAAYSGEVVAATYNSTMGNYVMINHNVNNYYTVYMHMSDLTVKTGQTVERGQVIGHMGNSGHVVPAPTPSNPYAGTHLHFALYIGTPYGGGYHVNPMRLY